MKKFLLPLLFLGLFSSVAHAEPITADLIRNYYIFLLPNGDKETAYFYQDNTVSLVPDIKNEQYVHTCWANWKFDEKKQTMRIKGAAQCRFFNGMYSTSIDNKRLVLTEGTKKLIFNPMKN